MKKAKYIEITRKIINPPKTDGYVPGIGEIIEVMEVVSRPRNKDAIYTKQGVYLVTGKTPHLILCEGVSNKRKFGRSFRITDFKAGILYAKKYVDRVRKA